MISIGHSNRNSIRSYIKLALVRTKVCVKRIVLNVRFMVCSDFVAVYQYISLASFSSEARSVVVCSSRSDHQLYLSLAGTIGVSRSICSRRVGSSSGS